MGIVIDFDFSAEIRIDLVFVLRSKITCFNVYIETNSVFVSKHRNRLDIRVGIEIDLIPVMGRN